MIINENDLFKNRHRETTNLSNKFSYLESTRNHKRHRTDTELTQIERRLIKLNKTNTNVVL